MDLSFINLPTSQEELLAILKIAYQAGQNSVGARSEARTISTGEENHIINIPVTYKKYTFKHWMSNLANQWSNAEE